LSRIEATFISYIAPMSRRAVRIGRRWAQRPVSMTV
jgi:hypothetical protein